MASGPDLATLIQTGNDIISLKLCVVSVTALWVYDYFLTLEDELRYGWNMENVFVLAVFLLIRYLPVLFQVWVIVAISYPGYTSEICGDTAFIQVMYYTFLAALAQIVLTQRAHAITGKKIWVSGILYTISTIQFGVGFYMFVWARLNPIHWTPAIPLDPYRLCIANATKAFTTIQMTLSLTFDIVAFTLVVMQIRLLRSAHQGIHVPRIINTVGRDAKVYFAVITTTHLLIVVMYITTRPGIGSIPIAGNGVFIPMIICRMAMSLKRVANTQQSHMSVGTLPGLPEDSQNAHPPHAVDNIKLSTLKKEQV